MITSRPASYHSGSWLCSTSMIDRRLWPSTTSVPTRSTPVSSGPRWWRLSSEAAIASRWSGAVPLALTKVSTPHMGDILPRPHQRASALPGETLVIPTGREQVRANDTFYPFRPGSDFAWLTGEYDPEAVLVLHPAAGGHNAVVYARPRSSRETDEFFRDSQYGELWVGR